MQSYTEKAIDKLINWNKKGTELHNHLILPQCQAHFNIHFLIHVTLRITCDLNIPASPWGPL